ncbi:MAG: P80 family lipoprotein [Mycoplasmatales bacterium]|nr:P80 family lipoprotein [Mycoplasmatales bacterium]
MGIKKIFMGIGTLSIAVAPIATSISCGSLLGSNGAYDSISDNKIAIQTTWSSGGAAYNALDTVVKEYNILEKDSPGFIEVKLEPVEGGYGTVASQAITKIISKDTRTLPNLYIDYPTSVGKINPYGMAFDVSSQVDRNLFDESFVKVNDEISGLPKGKLYSIPLANSSESLAINRPLMKYLLENAETVGAKIDWSGPTMEAIHNQNISSSDLENIKSQWGGLNSNDPNQLVGTTISEDIFVYYNSLFEFIDKVQPIFETPGKPNILGTDSPTNLIYELSSMQVQNNPNKFLFSKNDKTGFVDFNFLKAGSNEAQVFKNSYEILRKAIDKNAIWIGGGGAYGSTMLQQHQMAISIGSTAGLHFSIGKGSQNLNENEISFGLPISKYKSGKGPEQDENGNLIDWDKVSTTMKQGPSFNTIHINESEDNATGKFLNWFYTSDPVKFPATTKKMRPVDFFSQGSSYIVPIKGSLDADSVIGQKVDNVSYDKLKGSMIGVKASYMAMKNELERIKKYPETASFVETPVDDTVSSIRSKIDSIISASGNSKSYGGSAYTTQDVWEKIHREALIDQIIPDDGSLSHKYKYGNQLDRNFSDINWDKYAYVDARIISWTDGDTPKVEIIGKSDKPAVARFNVGEQISVRVAGIDTPESHAKMSTLVFEENGKSIPIDDRYMEALIKKYQDAGTPLAVKSSSGYVNLLSTDPKSYGYWKNVFVDIQEVGELGSRKGYDEIPTDSKNPNYNFDLRNAHVEYNGVDRQLFSKLTLREGYWGYLAGEYGRTQMPPGTIIRIATDGKKSYNRFVGSIFYGENLSKSWSVEVIKKGLALPFLSNPASVLDKKSIFWQSGQAIADEFNNSIEKKVGLFDSKGESLHDHLKKLLITHGTTNYEPLLKNSNAPGITTIYKYLETRAPDPSLTREGI